MNQARAEPRAVAEEAVASVSVACRQFVLECRASVVGSVSCRSLALRRRRWMLHEQVTVLRDGMDPTCIVNCDCGYTAN